MDVPQMFAKIKGFEYNPAVRPCGSGGRARQHRIVNDGAMRARLRARFVSMQLTRIWPQVSLRRVRRREESGLGGILRVAFPLSSATVVVALAGHHAVPACPHRCGLSYGRDDRCRKSMAPRATTRSPAPPGRTRSTAMRATTRSTAAT